MVSIDRLMYVVNTHTGKKRFKDLNNAIQFMQTWQKMHESYLSAHITVEVNRGLHKNKVSIDCSKCVAKDGDEDSFSNLGLEN